MAQYRVEADDGWRWLESYLTYANARLPQALLAAYDSTGDPMCLRVALDSLDFLVETQMVNGIFTPIGTEGWFIKGGERSFYDQQPIEASCMVEATVAAYALSGEDTYLKTAKTAFDWFSGKNTKSVVLYNGTTGMCYDGITPEGLNLNQGAEATLAYYLAYLKLTTPNLI